MENGSRVWTEGGAMDRMLVALKNIYKGFAGVEVLKNVSLAIAPGEIRCLAGENGCGKSTLIKVLSGVYTPDAGSIVLGGREYRALRPIDAIRGGVQVIYQDFSLFPNLTVAENLALNTQVSKGKMFVNWREMRTTASESLDEIGVSIDLKKLVGDLSVADKQLVAIARALLHNARLIVMDEPTTALTQKEVGALFSIIQKLKETGISILFVSHKMREMLDISEKITIMRNGAIVSEGEIGKYDAGAITYHMTGHSIDEVRYEGTRTEGKVPLLHVEKLGKSGVFKDVSFSLHSGEILGVTGLLGCGRTELALSLFGREPADSGRIFRDGREVVIRSVQDAMAQKIAYVPEDRLTEGLFLAQPITRNLFSATYDRYSNAFGLLDTSAIRSGTGDMLRSFDIATPNANNPVRSLSGGNQQRVVLARWMSTKARVLILNGPTVGVDVGSKFEIHKKLREIAGSGVAVMLFSDDIQELISNCNRILVMHKGSMVCELGGASLQENDIIDCLRRLS